MWSNFMWVLGNRLQVFVSTRQILHWMNHISSLWKSHESLGKFGDKNVYSPTTGTTIFYQGSSQKCYSVWEETPSREPTASLFLCVEELGAMKLTQLNLTACLQHLPIPPHETSAHPRMLDWARWLLVSASWTINSRGDSTRGSWSREERVCFQTQGRRKAVVLGTHMAFPKEEPSARSLVTIPGPGLLSVHPWGWPSQFPAWWDPQSPEPPRTASKHPTLPSATPLWLSGRCCSYLTCQLRLRPHRAKDERCEGLLTKKMKVI